MIFQTKRKQTRKKKKTGRVDLWSLESGLTVLAEIRENHNTIVMESSTVRLIVSMILLSKKRRKQYNMIIEAVKWRNAEKGNI